MEIKSQRCRANTKPAEIRLYDRLFTVENPDMDKERDFKEFLNPASLETLHNCILEPSLKDVEPDKQYQFE